MDLPWLLGVVFCGADVVGCGTGQIAGAHAPNSVARHRVLFHFGTKNDDGSAVVDSFVRFTAP